MADDATPTLVERARSTVIGARSRRCSRSSNGRRRRPRRRDPRCIRAPGNAWSIGITGAPGAGKSTLTDQLVGALRARRARGRRARGRPDAARSAAARSSATACACRATRPTPVCSSARWRRRGHLGGLALATPQAVRVLDAVGKAWIVDRDGRRRPGRGRDRGPRRHDGRRRESRAGATRCRPRRRADGDRRHLRREQGRPARAAADTVRDLARDARARRRYATWRPPIIRTIATTGEGIDELCDAIVGAPRRTSIERARPTHATARRGCGPRSARSSRHDMLASAPTRCRGERFESLVDAVVAARTRSVHAADALLDGHDESEPRIRSRRCWTRPRVGGSLPPTVGST